MFYSYEGELKKQDQALPIINGTQGPLQHLATYKIDKKGERIVKAPSRQQILPEN